MPHPSISTGTDFLSAKLHGLWGKAIYGERLRKLTGCVTEDLFFQSLSNQGFTVGRQDHFQQAIAMREISRLQKLCLQSGQAVSAFIYAKLRNLVDENLKVLLSYRFLQNRDIPIQELLIPIAGEAAWDPASLLEIQDLDQFISHLPESMRFPGLREVVHRLAKDRDFMAADCAIANNSFQQAISSAKALPFSIRGIGVELTGREIDITNLSMLLRNVSMYHIDPERMRNFWIQGGSILPKQRLQQLSFMKNVREVLDALPPALATILQPLKEQELYRCENALWSWLYRRAYQLFRDSAHPEYAVIAFPYLLRFESTNLGRIYEGIRFGMPVATIQEMMIGLS